MRISPYALLDIYGKDNTPWQGSRRLVEFFQEGLDKSIPNDRRKYTDGPLNLDAISVKDVARVLGMIDPFNEQTSIVRAIASSREIPIGSTYNELFSESNATVTTDAFQIITSALIDSALIEGYEGEANEFIGDKLVTVKKLGSRKGVKIPGVTALGGPLEVKEGHPYSETGFEEKYVVSEEVKKGRIISLTEELLREDQTGLVIERARNLGWYIRQDREKTIVEGVTDANASKGQYVYRPMGQGRELYPADGSLYNYVGAGNTTSTDYAAAVDLIDWESVDTIRQYRSSQVKDDRIDGVPQPIAGLNRPNNILLVPDNRYGVAAYTKAATTSTHNTRGSAYPVNQQQMAGTPISQLVSEVLTSPFMSKDFWYYGNPRRQFYWTEIYPLQTFSQGRGSEADFERDVSFRFKVRYYGGISAVDTFWFTRVDIS